MTTFPIALPGWIPWWLPFLVLVPGCLYLLAFLLMPFSVFGVKGRLEAIEARLDEIQAEIRHLTLRLPEAFGNGDFEDEPIALPQSPARQRPGTQAPPVAPAPPMPPIAVPLRLAAGSARGRPQVTRPIPTRTEPRLDSLR